MNYCALWHYALILLTTSRHGPRIKHRSSVGVQLLLLSDDMAYSPLLHEQLSARAAQKTTFLCCLRAAA
jgi:hypothetical protein